MKITIKDKNKDPLTGATVQVIRVSDSLTFNEVSDVNGQAQFLKLETGIYTIYTNYIGFKENVSNLRVEKKAYQLDIILEESALDLGEVTIVAKRPLISQEDDKMIIDPEPLAASSMSTLEVLEKTPGLFVDQDGNIFLNSASPAIVYINGREQKMSAQDIASILRSLPPGNIQKIEVLRTPSAKYDAASSGGIVNVVLKKGVKIGQNGSINSSMNQGNFGNQSAGFNLNNGGENQSSYLNLNYLKRDGLDELNSSRNGSLNSLIIQNAKTRTPGSQAFLGFGYNREIRKSWNINTDTRINVNGNKSDAENVTNIQSAEKQIISNNVNAIQNNNDFLSVNQDLGLNVKKDSIGFEWDTKVSFTYNLTNAAQLYSSSFSSPVSQMIEGNGDAMQNRKFLLTQTDLTFNLPWSVKMESGFKGTFQQFTSQADYFIKVNSLNTLDPVRTNSFNYKENITAAYFQFSKPLPGNLRVKTGLRAESTRMDGQQKIPYDTSFLIQRLDFFPYLYVSKPIFKIANYELNAFLIYRRTLNRPDYQNLNPAIRYVDQYFYETGNPALKPQFTDNIEANISFDNMPVFAVGRNYISDIFSNVVYQDKTNTNVLVRTFDNVGKNKETYFRLIAAIPPGGRYFFVLGTQYNLSEYDGIYENKPLTFTRGSWRFFTFHQIKLFKETKVNINGFLLLRGQQNFYELETFGQLNVSVNQSFYNKKLTISLSGNDILRTMVTRFSLQQGNVFTQGDRYGDNRRIGLNIRYAFGIQKKETRQGIIPNDFD
ncbi:MAG: TonB-dependent receptor [Bacteroidetes bacterium]|nr:TonB-dependent receptor [Bacteroidota bacterium]